MNRLKIEPLCGSWRQWRCAISICFLAVFTTISGGCNIVGPAAYILEGPPKVDAMYVLADVPTVVYIDDRANVVNPISLRRVIADKTSEVLMVKEVLKTTISPQDAMSLAVKRERYSDILSIEEIGKMVGAKQVIYVEMLNFQRSPDGNIPRPYALCRVRVIDVENRVRTFPGPDAQENSHPVQTMTREVDPEAFRNSSTRLKLYEELAKRLGDEIAKLFYKHEARELGGNLK
jgi:hypothetical protein